MIDHPPTSPKRGTSAGSGWPRPTTTSPGDGPRRAVSSTKELFFPTGTSRLSALETQRAKLICASCSVRPACLQFALATNQEFGVWGGCDEDERRRLRRGTGGEPPIPPNA